MTPPVQRVAQASAQQDRCGALELEKDALKQQIADLNDKLSKLQREFDDARSAMENMVPRCVYACVHVGPL
jgi:hypothetical protein